MMMHLIVAFILLAVFAYFATYIDDHFQIYSLGYTFTIGTIACLLWPLTLAASIIVVPLILIMRWGANRRGDNF